MTKSIISIWKTTAKQMQLAIALKIYLSDKALDAKRLDLCVNEQPTVCFDQGRGQRNIHLGLGAFDNVRHDAVNERHFGVHS